MSDDFRRPACYDTAPGAFGPSRGDLAGTVRILIRTKLTSRGCSLGFLDTVKGWLNIGGVKVKLQDVNPRVSRSGSQITGKVLLTSKGDKHVLKLTYKFIVQKTTGRGEDRKTKEFTLSQTALNEPFDIKTGESRALDFSIPYSLEKALKDQGGVLGAVGKIGAFAVGEKEEFFVVAECDVKGTALDPSDKVEVTLVD
jgi:sporulation-control protein spo0M